MKKFFWLFTIFMPNVYASNPTYDATRGALQNNSALCGYGYNSDCPKEENNGSRHIVRNITINLPSKYGALAMNSHKKGHITGYLNADSEAEAKAKALEKCERESGAKCKVTSWARNGCLAAAAGKKGQYFKIFSKAGAQGKVETDALNACKKSGAKDCRILMPEGCSLPEIPR